MYLKVYNYPRDRRALDIFLGMSFLLFGLSISGTVLLLMVWVHHAVSCAGVGIVLWSLLLPGTTGTLTLSKRPAIGVTLEGIVLTALPLWSIFIPWSDIISIREVSRSSVDHIVLARHITPLHHLYGWIWAKSLHPGFLIGREMLEREDLVKEIQNHMGATRNP